MRKQRKITVYVLLILVIGGLTSFVLTKSNAKKGKANCCAEHSATKPKKKMSFIKQFLGGSKALKVEEIKTEGCVFRSLMGKDSLADNIEIVLPDNVRDAVNGGKTWLFKSQLADGGWGAGYHHNQSKKDPHSVQSDPATTSLVGMALMRSDPSNESQALKNCIAYLIKVTEASPSNSENITTLKSTQPQVKLGQNIDVVLAAQFFSNALDFLSSNDSRVGKIKKCLDLCAAKIEMNQNDDGSSKKDGWAGVLQSSFASNALESADKKGAKVDRAKLERSRDYQKGNFDLSSGKIKTEKGAGVMLYSVSGSSRGSAEETKVVKRSVKKAKEEGVLAKDAEVSIDNLKKIGFSDDKAQKSYTAYQINKASKVRAQEDEVMTGFGNNGGEEFLSYLQTGEGLIIAEDEDWNKWYEKISATLLNIQNKDGSWEGHHCITSPVFCTATCVLILSIQNDIQNLQASVH